MAKYNVLSPHNFRISLAVVVDLAAVVVAFVAEVDDAGALVQQTEISDNIVRQHKIKKTAFTCRPSAKMGHN